jgi:hypothetical protein
MSEQRATTVPGQYLGFSLQVSRLLDHLLRARRGEVVSLEAFADTGVTRPDGSVIAEESKSRVSDGNPIADRSVDFWKTIRNWVSDVIAGRLAPPTTLFRLYVSQQFPSSIAKAFHEATTPEAALEAYFFARRQLWDDEDDVPLPSLGETIRPYLHVVFRADPELVVSIIQSFQLEFGSGSTFDDLRARISEKFVADEFIETAMNQMLGWIKRATDEAIGRGLPATIHYDEFHKYVTSVVQKLNQIGILHSFASDPDDKDVQEHLRLRRYVRQLELIELDDDVKTRAVMDYLRAEVDRVQWSKQLRVTEKDLSNFENELVQVWSTKKQLCSIRNTGKPEVVHGVDLYSECSLHHVRIGGADPPEHFCRGSLHELADRRVPPHIGWHPRYADLLTECPEAADGTQ